MTTIFQKVNFKIIFDFWWHYSSFIHNFLTLLFHKVNESVINTGHEPLVLISNNNRNTLDERTRSYTFNTNVCHNTPRSSPNHLNNTPHPCPNVRLDKTPPLTPNNTHNNYTRFNNDVDVFRSSTPNTFRSNPSPTSELTFPVKWTIFTKSVHGYVQTPVFYYLHIICIYQCKHQLQMHLA